MTSKKDFHREGLQLLQGMSVPISPMCPSMGNQGSWVALRRARQGSISQSSHGQLQQIWYCPGSTFLGKEWAERRKMAKGQQALEPSPVPTLNILAAKEQQWSPSQENNALLPTHIHTDTHICLHVPMRIYMRHTGIHTHSHIHFQPQNTKKQHHLNYCAERKQTSEGNFPNMCLRLSCPFPWTNGGESAPVTTTSQVLFSNHPPHHHHIMATWPLTWETGCLGLANYSNNDNLFFSSKKKKNHGTQIGIMKIKCSKS